MPNAWISHVKKFAKAHPNLSYSEAMSQARASYHPQKGGSRMTQMEQQLLARDREDKNLDRRPQYSTQSKRDLTFQLPPRSRIPVGTVLPQVDESSLSTGFSSLSKGKSALRFPPRNSPSVAVAAPSSIPVLSTATAIHQVENSDVSGTSSTQTADTSTHSNPAVEMQTVGEKIKKAAAVTAAKMVKLADDQQKSMSKLTAGPTASLAPSPGKSEAKNNKKR